ncbi:MAG: archaetidylserine decarboxylase [Stagnimonas sp.]|nr:archaetidylserine decarboxylase [Stagnimonas sp.]
MTDASLSDRLFAAIQQALPTRALSSGMHALTRIETVWFKDVFIKVFMRLFPSISLDEAVVQDATQFKSFNAFFTRALKPSARAVDAATSAFVSPVDGTVSQFGDIANGTLIQAKGHTYSAQTLLAGRADWAAEFAGGQFITIYLAPYNYHRIHMPLKGTLREWAYVPGRLFSVNHATARALPGVFARNERVVALFDTELGPMAMVLVGALFVGSMETVWAGEISPPHVRDPEPKIYAQRDTITLEKGMEMGRFNMGSTVILLTPKKLDWLNGLASKQPLQMGQRIATTN